jgi:hypothetical protein
MRKTGMWVLAWVLSTCITVVAQDSARGGASPKSAKAQHSRTIRLSGKVSDDGTRFIDDAKQRVWVIKNIEVLKGFESQQASLRGRVDGDTNLIEVLSIAGEETHTAHLSDSAFRR